MNAETFAHLFKNMQERIAHGENYSLPDLWFGGFHWLLSSDQAEALQAWTKVKVPNWDGDVIEVDPSPAKAGKIDEKKKAKAASVAQDLDELADHAFG